MALVASMDTTHGVSLDNAYIRVVGFRGDKNSVMVTAYVYVSEQARREGKKEIDRIDHEVLISNDLPVMQNLYNGLRDIESLACARDV